MPERQEIGLERRVYSIIHCKDSSKHSKSESGKDRYDM